MVEALREGSKGYDDAMQSMIASGELMSNAEIKRLQAAPCPHCGEKCDLREEAKP